MDDLIGLAQRCHAADGGLPHAAEPQFLRGRWSGPAVIAEEVRDGARQLLAAGAVRPSGGGVAYTGLIDPAARGRGLGGRLLDWGLGRTAPVTVESEGLTPEAESLFASRGLRQVFAEDVMRIEVRGSEPPAWPAGVELVNWDDAVAPRFFAVYHAAFRERPGFPDPSAGEWIADVTDDDQFRPGWSVLAVVPGRGDAGFVTAADGWIVQVGVIPAARGAGVGAALIREALSRMRADGATEAWLDVNVNNPADRLYRRLGFENRGRRARYTR
jgi:mycothiol synthase